VVHRIGAALKAAQQRSGAATEEAEPPEPSAETEPEPEPAAAEPEPQPEATDAAWKEQYVEQCITAWAAVESNPQCFDELCHALGVPEGWSWSDVYGLEPELLSFVPQPVAAVTLLWPSDSLAILEFKASQRKARAQAKAKEVEAPREGECAV
jgi:hypothetical protein